MSEEQKIPTTEEFIAHMEEQIKIAEVRAKLQALNTAIAKDRAEELNALVFIAQVTNPKSQGETSPSEEGDEEEIPAPPSAKRKLKTD